MKITSITSTFTFTAPDTVSGAKSEMSLTMTAEPDDPFNFPWTLDQAKEAHIILARTVVSDVYLAMCAQGSVDPAVSKPYLDKMQARFSSVQAKRSAMVAEAKAQEEVPDVI
jgi:hypothetical protein